MELFGSNSVYEIVKSKTGDLVKRDNKLFREYVKKYYKYIVNGEKRG